MFNIFHRKRLYFLFSIILTLLIIVIIFENYGRTSNEITKIRFNFPNTTYFETINNKRTNLKQLFDIVDFYYKIVPNADFCKITDVNSGIKAVFIVTSHINNVETRSAMRRAFPRDVLEKLQIRRVFLLGVTSDNKYITQKAVEDEGQRFGDLVQGNFLEAYRNLTYKHMMGLKWVGENCDKAQFVIKMDDDIVVHLVKLLGLLQNLNADEKFIAGYLLEGLKAKREKANKWFVTKDEYGLDVYPPFVSGWLYITTPVVCKDLERVSSTEKYFWIDDVFVTGILAQKLHIRVLNFKKYFTDHPEYFQCCLNDFIKYQYDCDIVVGPNGGRTNLFYEFNKVFSTCIENKCLNRFLRNESCISMKTTNLGRGSAVISAYKLF